MAQKKTAAALAEASGDALSAEETQMMADNQASENDRSEPEAALAPEAEKETAPATPEGEAQPDIDPATGQQRKVDYGAFHAERAKRKAAEAKSQETEKQLATAMGRFSVLEQLAKQNIPKAEVMPTEAPDINTDPVGHFKALYEQSQQKIGDLDKWRQTQEANATAMNNVQQLTRIALSHEGEFSKKIPDYQEAASYVRSVRDQELQAMGYADPGVRQQIIQSDALQIAAQALQNNMNAAEVVYNIAKARGWQIKAPAPAAAQIGDTKKLETVAKGQKQASPLSEANGSAPAEMSVKALLDMSDSDFEKATKGDNWRKLFT